MATTPYGLSDAGYTAPRAADILAVMRDEIETEIGAAVDWDNDLVLSAIVTSAASRIGELAQSGQALVDAWSPANATGLPLSDLSLIVGVTRDPATSSTCPVTITGTPGTVIASSRIIESTADRSRWLTSENVTIGGGGTVSATVVAQVPGVVTAEPGDLTTIVTPVAGWTSVTNAAAATPGVDVESDASLRKRRQQSLQTAGSRSLNALRSNILAIDDVDAAVVVENDSNATATVEGISLPAHSIGVVVHPSTMTTATKQLVAQAIYDHVAAGIYTEGSDVVATVTGLDNVGHVVRFDFAGETTVNVGITVDLEDGYELADVETPIEEAVTDYFLALGVGQRVRLLGIAALLDAIDGVRGAVILLNGVAADVDPNATSLAVEGTTTVGV